MENQHKLIKGYRELTQVEINLMNKIKSLGNELGDLIALLRSEPFHDTIWIASGEMDLKKGIMALTRAVAKPTSF